MEEKIRVRASVFKMRPITILILSQIIIPGSLSNWKFRISLIIVPANTNGRQPRCLALEAFARAKILGFGATFGRALAR